MAKKFEDKETKWNERDYNDELERKTSIAANVSLASYVILTICLVLSIFLEETFISLIGIGSLFLGFVIEEIIFRL